jgi:hypothetical protein
MSWASPMAGFVVTTLGRIWVTPEEVLGTEYQGLCQLREVRSATVHPEDYRRPICFEFALAHRVSLLSSSIIVAPLLA